MSKRFLDSEMWDKRWIRLLKPAHKLFWVYILSKCNHAGIWEVDLDLASFQLGIDLNREELLFIFKDKIIEANGGSKWFLTGYIEFQYGVLDPHNRVHKSAISLLDRYKIPYSTCIINNEQDPIKPLKQPLLGCKDKDKDKAKNKDKELNNEHFERIWSRYPRKKGKDRAKKHFNAQVKTEEDWTNINLALDNYLSEIQRMEKDEQHIKQGETWFNHHWEDDITYQPPPPPKPIFTAPTPRGVSPV